MTERSIVRGVASVTVGTVFAQVGGSLGQFAYAIWLTPSDFGVWAAASASVALLGAFVNLGEANGYLAGSSVGLASTLRETLWVNGVLALVAALLGAFYGINGGAELALLVLLLAVSLPLQGLSGMFIAAFIKSRLHTDLVVAQVIATLLRLSVGMVTAAIWRSPIALAIALLMNYCAMAVIMRLQARLHAPQILGSSSSRNAHWPLRVNRAIHQFTQTLPTQVDYLILSLVATTQLLGLYFLAYQATAAISGLVAAPLSKTTMAELVHIPSAGRARVVSRLLLGILGLSGIAAAIGGFCALEIRLVLPGQWTDVMAPFAILLASVPARFMAPISESLNMVNGKWARSSVINVVDTFGTALAAASAVTGDVVVVATTVALWKGLFGCGRVLIALAGLRPLVLLSIVIPPIGCIILTAYAVNLHGSLDWFIVLAIVALSGLQVFCLGLVK